MSQSKYARHIERNKILTEYYDHMMPAVQKEVIRSNMSTMLRKIKNKNPRANMGEVSALEVLYELGRFLNGLEE